MRLFFVVLSMAIALSAFGQAPLDAKTIDRLMVTMMREWQIPGAAIAIVRNDKVVYVNGYGSKDLGGTEPVTPETLFQIASTSKAFTTTALAMLATDRKLTWDDPVRQHLEYFRLSDPCADANVTLRDIVSHRTGVTRHDELWDNAPFSREEVVRKIGSIKPAKPFRTAYQYQNIMFIAAGEVVTHASGMTWDDFVRTRIFKPLGMTRTVISDAEWEAAADRARGHRYDWKTGRMSPQRPGETTTIGAGGAIKSSARDMGNWIRFQLADGSFNDTQLVDPEQLAETKTPHTVIRLERLPREMNPETRVMSYGLGWAIQDYRGELLVSHSGALNGFRTHVDLLPQRNAGFAVMINAGRGMALVALRNSLADLLSGKPVRDWNAYYLMVDRRADEKDAKDREERIARRHPDTTPTHSLPAYAGTYENAAYGPLTITVVEGKLVLQWARLTIPLTHFHYDVFTAYSEYDDVDEEVVFGLDEARAVKTVRLFGEIFAKR